MQDQRNLGAITLANGHGTFTASSLSVSVVLARYLHKTSREMRIDWCERVGVPEWAYADVTDVAAFAVMLAELDES
jgi:hypothetical protein